MQSVKLVSIPLPSQNQDFKMILKDALLAVKYKTEDRVYAVVNKKFNEPQQSEHVASVSATATYLKVTVTVSTVIVLSVDVRAGSLHARVA